MVSTQTDFFTSIKNRLRLLSAPIVAACAALTLTACISTHVDSNLPPAPKSMNPTFTLASTLEPYRLQIGDVLDIKFILNPELNEQTAVRPDGFISTSATDDIPAYGRTVNQLRTELEEKYHNLLSNPRIGVIVRSFAPNRVYVTGEVNNPGEFITVGPNLTLLQAIARAGGVKNSAQTDNIVIIRRGAGEKPLAYHASYNDAASGSDPASDVRLASYDVVYVPRSGIANAYLHFQQYLQEFVPLNVGASYQLNNPYNAPLAAR